ncbi:MAG: UDP-2,3-diacylglucosamine diphosphatase LpxI [Elusimicrobia bacterium]|nr:UDP-2,3-diacylglucosamine diphosphatase LpxI [Elusimicrobiota bacterium]MBK7208185.1 UDP-2,3-diacylglucosamine diphosphatase LpxI [Elusimicrobiota bacterium]MBK7544949.1 UDP-2,3-diacylglucosamine diphosphatase LpxI [Elusimicrobiota bacterium]MBK7574466.1 UDP-2,3-diacylglucosamine diphosphatase LpxI [Elusimicrobiota bacterium]MBK7688170.1 UDP-2,3-diacylglucosamine diphosphatase LpxI [Elusimicrobiota bacterium]
MTPLGLIAGNGRFPFLLADEARRQGRPVVAAAIEGETDPALADHVDRIHWLKLGQIKRTIQIFKEAGAGDAVMAGQVKHASIFDLRHLDATAVKILATLPDKKTDTILSAVADVFAKEGIRLMSSVAYLGEALAPEGVITRARPSNEQKRDIAFGFKTAKAVAGLDLGQTVCVKDQAVLAVEAIEGTDACIRRAGEHQAGCVAVKVAKPRQDLRFDVPVVGRRTLESLAAAKAAVLAVEAGKTLFFDREEFLKEADAVGLIVVGVKE